MPVWFFLWTFKLRLPLEATKMNSFVCARLFILFFLKRTELNCMFSHLVSQQVVKTVMMVSWAGQELDSTVQKSAHLRLRWSMLNSMYLSSVTTTVKFFENRRISHFTRVNTGCFCCSNSSSVKYKVSIFCTEIKTVYGSICVSTIECINYFLKTVNAARAALMEH